MTIPLRSALGSGRRPSNSPAVREQTLMRVRFDLEDGLPSILTDVSTLPGQALRQDTITCANGGLFQTTTLDDNYPATGPGEVLSTGWRAACVADLGVSRVMIRTFTDIRIDPAQGGGGMALFVNDATELALGFWYNPFGWFEIGLVGLDALDFEYLDMTFISAERVAELIEAAEANGGFSVADLYVTETKAWVVVDGFPIVGPVDIPEALQGSTMHGAQLDIGSPAPTVSNLVEMHALSYNGPVKDDYPPPSFLSGTPVKGTGTTINVPVPSGAVQGDLAVLTIGHSTGTLSTPSGWTLVSTGTVTGMTVGQFTRTITGSEGWGSTLAVTTPSANTVGHLAIFHAANFDTPYQAGVVQDTDVDTSKSVPSMSFAGPHRASIAWVATAVASTQSWPTGWTVTSAAGATDVGLSVGIVSDWSDSVLELTRSEGFAHLRTTPAAAVTLGTASRAAIIHDAVFPNPLTSE